jgi:hypothetical protein
MKKNCPFHKINNYQFYKIIANFTKLVTNIIPILLKICNKKNLFCHFQKYLKKTQFYYTKSHILEYLHMQTIL